MIATLARRTALLGAACFAYGLVEARTFRVRRYDLPILPAGAGDVRVLHVSDIHLAARQRYKTDFVRSLAGLEPDLVVTTGDNICEAAALEPLMDAWGRLLRVPGVFVFGSNDYSAPRFNNPLGYLVSPTSPEADRPRPTLPTERLRAAMSAHGWVDLTERREVLTVRGVRIEFRGTDDAHLDRDDYAAVAGPPAADTDLAVGVTHAPYLRLLDGMTADGVQLILAGHTHGGQVCVPGYGALVTNCDLDTSMASGLHYYEADGRTSRLHVSAGMGSSPFAPYRFACAPEVSLLTLRAPDPDASRGRYA